MSAVASEAQSIGGCGGIGMKRRAIERQIGALAPVLRRTFSHGGVCALRTPASQTEVG